MPTKRDTEAAATGKIFDPEIKRLLYIGTIIQSLIQRGGPLLDVGEFPKSVDAIGKLTKAFDRELEVNLLRAYDKAEAPPNPMPQHANSPVRKF
jgi:hypothetical protein